MPRLAAWVLPLLLLLAANVHAGDRWPAFRGGALAGVEEAKSLPDEWSATRNAVWCVEIPGRGWSSPIVWGDKVFVTAVVSDGKLRNPQKGLYINDLQGKVEAGEHRWLVLCLDFKTGKTLWEREAAKGIPAGPIHLKNTYASETPVTDGERVYAYFGNVGVFAFDFQGELKWSEKFSPVKTKMGWGTAASPALYKDRLYLVNDNEEKSWLIALDAKTGKQQWRIEREEKSNWATPFVWENDQRTELVTAGTNKVRGYDLDSKLLWELGNNSSLSIPTPFSRHGLLYVTSGYVLDGRKPLYAIKPGASGDLTLKTDETSNKHIAWCQKTAGPYHPTPLVYGDYLYVLYDRGFLSCFNAKTGEKVYDKERIATNAQAFTASPWGYDGKVFCLSEDGETFVIEAGPTFKVLGKNSLDEMTLATPALAGGSLIVRTMSKLYRFEKGAGK
jgi:outer membrane protein assembly factor BamB